MILIANMICDCRFVADTCCPGLFCSSEDSWQTQRDAIWIRKTDNMNRDEGSYQLSHVWNKLLHTDDRHQKSVLMKASDVKPKRR